jgi:DNA-binding transcriptional regulator YiaG
LSKSEENKFKAQGRTIAGTRQGKLGAAMAVARVKHPQKLAGRDVRFLRKEMRLTPKAFAGKIGVHVETVSRWENDREAIDPSSEKLLRRMVLIELGDAALGVDYDERAVAAMRVEAVRRGRGFEARSSSRPCASNASGSRSGANYLPRRRDRRAG